MPAVRHAGLGAGRGTFRDVGADAATLQQVQLQWDDIRDFLSIHYRFNRRLDTEFWRAARSDVDLAGASELVAFWQQHGPSGLPHGILLNPASAFGLEGYYALLSGMQVPVAHPYQPTDAERKAWRTNVKALGEEARNGVGVVEGLRILRGES